MTEKLVGLLVKHTCYRNIVANIIPTNLTREQIQHIIKDLCPRCPAKRIYACYDMEPPNWNKEAKAYAESTGTGGTETFRYLQQQGALCFQEYNCRAVLFSGEEIDCQKTL